MVLGLSPEVFNAFLDGIGVTAEWSQASACPCRSVRTGGSDVACPVCEGLRFTWGLPIPVTIGIQGIRTDRKWAQFGEWQSGDVLCTIGSDSPAYTAGEYDRFIITEAEHRWSTVLAKNVTDRLKHRHIKRVERAWGILNDAPVELIEFVDWKLVDRTVTWEPTSTFPDESQYSIRYVAAPEYYIFYHGPAGSAAV